MSPIKKSFSFILILAILFNSGGYYFLFCIMQNNIQREIKHKIRNSLNDEELTLIVSSKENEKKIQWIKPNKEFRFKGEMYDVVRATMVKGIKYLYCINDSKEKTLLANYNKNHNNRNGFSKRFKRMLTNMFFPKSQILLSSLYSSKYSYNIFVFNFSSIIIEKSSPPPKIC